MSIKYHTAKRKTTYCSEVRQVTFGAHGRGSVDVVRQLVVQMLGHHVRVYACHDIAT